MIKKRPDDCPDLAAPTRNHFFYGKLMDAFHFDLETAYLNQKRWLINRYVHGCGVVCGFDVDIEDETTVLIQPGLALDGCGREIIVPSPRPYALEIPAQAPGDADHKSRPAYAGKEPGSGKEPKDPETLDFKLSICYQECLDQPDRVHAGECGQQLPCQPSTIHERYRVVCERGKFESPCDLLKITDVIKTKTTHSGQRAYKLLYKTLVEDVVSRPCHVDESCVPCIPLANICVIWDEGAGKFRIADDGIDISVRPIVLSNHHLFQLLLSLIYER